ncbi:hypothetical protein [Fibrobacter sp. UWB7]|uniref:hypothetical protein n=1 Tax=Fibrobacter sp. UWB7 TaxID=1896206 RepID=UPI0009176F58|nr:hypothetical protein [Fibrobacter sp. UWB7]SHM78530.1 hypothetical protein SAMN05720467_2352 [Fibrobacter sp. UWB7]
MNKFGEIVLKTLHRAFCKLCVPPRDSTRNCIIDPELASKRIYNLLESDKPCLVCRYGSTELNCLLNYISVKKGGFPVFDYIANKRYQWWWNELCIKQMQKWSGFFPIEIPLIEKFCECMLGASRQIDILGHWIDQEVLLKEYWPNTMEKVNLLMLEPYWSKNPWTRALKGKKVVVVHPFAELIEKQYKEKRTLLFKNQDVLPEFELRTVKAVQSLGGDCDEFKNWFDALDWMKKELDKESYDVVLIGCGAYGMPLAAYSKQTGHKAVHLAGALQLLFGIRGKRWDDPNYGIQEFGVRNKYKELFNEFWVYPDESFKPKSYKNVENGCYW